MLGIIVVYMFPAFMKMHINNLLIKIEKTEEESKAC